MRYVIRNDATGKFLTEAPRWTENVEDAWMYPTREEAESELSEGESVCAVRVVLVEEPSPAQRDVVADPAGEGSGQPGPG